MQAVQHKGIIQVSLKSNAEWVHSNYGLGLGGVKRLVDRIQFNQKLILRVSISGFTPDFTFSIGLGLKVQARYGINEVALVRVGFMQCNGCARRCSLTHPEENVVARVVALNEE
ncbi:hypothetical protein Tco_0801096 [Tanacetum coccineum]|uniref:Uncharacterized protein n=1 Tax=Tanacetum coccineum TaxID=301880 RepID=A0ABQ4ZZ76_9ASTR